MKGHNFYDKDWQVISGKLETLSAKPSLRFTHKSGYKKIVIITNTDVKYLYESFVIGVLGPSPQYKFDFHNIDSLIVGNDLLCIVTDYLDTYLYLHKNDIEFAHKYFIEEQIRKAIGG